MTEPAASPNDSPASTPRLLLLHGFGQNRNCWDTIPEAIVEHYEVIAVDLPGHGSAGAIETDVWGAADLLADVLGDHGPTTVVLGYSMGGRIALHLALAYPDLVDRLVVIGATPGIVDDTERSARLDADLELATRIETVGIETFVDEWLALPMFAGLSPEMQYRAERLGNNARGLASSLRRCGTGAQEPLWTRLGELAMPTLLMTGSLDTKFTAIAAEMASLIGPNSTHVIIEGAGHTAHLEQPVAFAVELTRWIDQI